MKKNMVVRVSSYRLFGHSTRLFRSTSADGAPSLPRPTKQRSKYAEWYSEMLPPMIPIALLAATVYGVCNSTFCSLLFKPGYRFCRFSGPSSRPFWLVQSGRAGGPLSLFLYVCGNIDQLITDILRTSSLASETSHGHDTHTHLFLFLLFSHILGRVNTQHLRAFTQKDIGNESVVACP